MNHKVGRILFALIVGLSVAYLSYGWITNPEPRAERVLQENVVVTSRQILRSVIEAETLEIVDPLAPRRAIGKVYIYRQGGNGGWAVSGYYRRDENDRWHPYLMTLTAERVLEYLKIQDQDRHLIERAENDLTFEVSS